MRAGDRLIYIAIYLLQAWILGPEITRFIELSLTDPDFGSFNQHCDVQVIA